MKTTIFACIVSALVAVSGFLFYDMKSMGIENLVLCSSNEGGMPLPAPVCRYYMLNYRLNEADIKQLAQGAGLDYILNTERMDKYDIAKVFLAKGLDINGINHYSDQGLTPLHGAVLANDLDRVRFLLSQGADARLRLKNNGPTPLELARKLDEMNEDDNRDEMIAALSSF